MLIMIITEFTAFKLDGQDQGQTPEHKLLVICDVPCQNESNVGKFEI